jgi:hypothetical protein
MSIHGLLQEPASYPSNFITLPFTIPPPPSYGSQIFKSSRRSVTSTGGVPTMTAGQALQDTIFDFSPININLSRVVVTLHLDDATDYLGVDPFGMVCWEYGATSSEIIITTFNTGAADITDWSVELIAFPLSGSTALLSYVNDTNQNTRFSVANGAVAAPTPAVKWTFNPPVGSSFNENQIVIGESGILYIAEDGGKLLAVTDNGASASILWSVDTGFTGLVPPALGNVDTLYGVGTNTMKCVANISTVTPSVVWTANLTPLTAPLPPLIQYDIYGVPTIFVSGTGKIYSVNVSGVVNWVYSPPVSAVTYLGIKSDGSVIYATASNQLYALTSAGVLKWSLTVGANAGYPTIGSDGTIYFTSGVTIYAVTDNGALGTLKWTVNSGALSGSLARALAIGSNDVIYATNITTTGANSRIFAIVDNGASATVKWAVNTLPTNPPSLTSPTVGNNGLIYTTGDYGYLACVTDNGASFTVNWGYQTAPAGFSSPCSIGTNQRVYLGGDHDLIVAV